MTRNADAQMPRLLPIWLALFVAISSIAAVSASVVLAEPPKPEFLWGTAYAIPKETTSEESGYFSIIEGAAQHGKSGLIYIGTAKYNANAYLVEFNPETQKMQIVLDAHKELGTSVTGFPAQSKLHTRNNRGASGKIYVGTKQGYPKPPEKVTDYLGGYPMVYDPKTGKTRVYPIPVPHHGIISITPDESRGIAYISTCIDSRPIDCTHFMILNLETGKYRDLIDAQHMYAFIVLDHQGRAYHPMLGGDIARWDPATEKLERLKQTIGGVPPSADSHLADAESHPINWDVSPDGKTLYSVAMSGNQLYSYDLTSPGPTLAGRALGKLVPTATSTDCRALCVGPTGDAWAAVSAEMPGIGRQVHLVSYHPGDAAPKDRGPVAVRNPDYTQFVDAAGKALVWHQGMTKIADGTMVPLYPMGICQANDGTVNVTALYPFTLLQVKFPNAR